MKTRYLVGYSFGAGSGGHMYIWSRSAQEIEAKYPELKVVDTVPGWMQSTPDLLENIERNLTFDIDNPPAGVLQTIIQSRSKP